MVRVLLGLWVVVTGLTFYSALWYKSGSIEADITTKTETALAATNLPPVRLDVDGRHVRLSGHLNAEDDRARYVSAVQEVGGALGPGDGLILREPHGFIAAQKVGDAVSLSGSVPNEETRRALVEAVQRAVPGGTLEDHLAITGGTSEMAEMLTPALAVLGHLNSAQLTITPTQRSVNGQAALPGSEAVIDSLVGPETGWTGQVVPASRDADLAQRVAELSATLGETEANRDALAANLAQAQSRIESLTTERTAYADATQNLSDQILMLKASTVDMATFNTAQDRLALLENQSALQARTIGAARVQTTEQSTRLSNLADQLSRLEQQTVLQARTLGAARAQVQEDQTTIQSLTQERDGLTQSLKVLEPQALLQAKTIGAARRQVAASAAELAELTKAKNDLEAQLDDLTVQSRLQAKTIGAARVFATETEAQRIANAAELERLAAQVAALAPQAVLQAKTIGAARVQTAQLESELAELNAGVATRDAEISALSADLASNQAAFRGATRQYQKQRAQIADLVAEVDLYQDRAAAARTDLGAMTRLRDDLAAVLKRTEEDLEEASTAATLLGDMQTRLAEVTRARNISERKVGILDTRIARLETSLAQAEALADAPQTEAMASCNALAERMLEGSRINFLSSSATITLNSVPLLERLTGIALACVTTGGTLEIGGHTDSRGSDSANQALSEERAQAVRTFMIERGINAGRLNAVGFGESQPVADNDTAEGQAANRRISFTWRQE